MVTAAVPKPEQKDEVTNRGKAFSPYGEFPLFMSRMRDEFFHMFDRFTRAWPGLWGGAGNGWRWGLDVKEDFDKITVRAEAPGFEAGDFDIRVTDNRLILSAVKKAEAKDEKGKVREFSEQECCESVTLPPGIDKDRAEAEYRKGILTVTFPKTAEGKGKRIAVKGS
jgi:HSP20 family protein